MEKVVEGVAWGLRDHGSPIEKRPFRVGEARRSLG